MDALLNSFIYDFVFNFCSCGWNNCLRKVNRHLGPMSLYSACMIIGLSQNGFPLGVVVLGGNVCDYSVISLFEI